MANYNIKTFNDYYDTLSNDLKSGKPVTEQNHDRVHNVAIVRLMLENSSKVNIFCGRMTIFRSEFYEHIALSYGRELADQLKEILAQSLRKFLSDKSKTLCILNENYHPEMMDDLIVPAELFRRSIANGNLNIKRLDDDFLWSDKLSHFCCAPDISAMRLESDKSLHEGIFTANISGLVAMAETNFNDLWKYSVAI